MKKATPIFLLIALLCTGLSSQLLHAQTLSMKAKKLEATGKPGDFLDTDCELKNLSGNEIQVRVLQTKANLPEGWEVSFCLVNCYAPGATDITENVPANGTFDFKISWSTGATPATGEVEYTLTNVATPSEKYVFTFSVTTGTVGIERVAPPKALTLAQNYPNPFVSGSLSVTTIGFAVPKQGAVSVKVYNLVGREVRTLVNDAHTPGVYSAAWDGRDSDGALVPPGIYIYKITTGQSSLSRRMVVSR